MTRANDPAFARPFSAEPAQGGERICEQDGLTKREYFAAAALQGLLSCADVQRFSFPIIAAMAQQAADALVVKLNERDGAA